MTEYLKSPLNYTGSKFNLLPEIKNNLPKDRTILYDLFCGGGSVFVNLLPNYQTIYANDILIPLIRLYNFLQNNKWEDVIELISSEKIDKDSQEQYVKLREDFNLTGDFIKFFILVCSCTNNMMRFNKKFEFNQTWGKRTYNPSTEIKLKAYHNKIFSNNNLVLTHQSFETYDIDFANGIVYLDPPYYITNAGYNCYWSKNKEIMLYDFIDNLNKNGCKFLLSNVSEHKGIKNPYINRLSKYRIIDIEQNYDIVSRTGKSFSKEILVKNYEN